jgi:hypothetical protein
MGCRSAGLEDSGDIKIPGSNRESKDDSSVVRQVIQSVCLVTHVRFVCEVLRFLLPACEQMLFSEALARL